MGSTSTMIKSFHADTVTGVKTSFPQTQIISITALSTNSNDVIVKDLNNGNSFIISAGETVVLNWGFVNAPLSVSASSGDTARVIYYT